MDKSVKPLEELLDSVRDIEGFPIGSDEDILALSNPPYYTACPNPYIANFIYKFGSPYDEQTDRYHKEPFVADISEGKTDPIYNAHGYHTKVPYKAILPFIDHFTCKGDIVLDGFCGTGMTGYAASSLGRHTILSDLSPFASFIAFNYTSGQSKAIFETEANRILSEVRKETGWMYKTDHHGELGDVNFIVWSDVLLCPYCNREYVFYEAAMDQTNGSVKKEYDCPSCNALISKKQCERVLNSTYDRFTGENFVATKQQPILINYTFEEEKYEKKPDQKDLEIIEKINEMEMPYKVPTNKMMNIGAKWGDSWRAGYHIGMTRVHHFFSKRNLWILGLVFDRIEKTGKDIQPFLRFVFEQAVLGMSKLNRYVPTHFSQVNRYLSGTLYVGSQIAETSLEYVIRGKIKRLSKIIDQLEFNNQTPRIVSTQSLTCVPNIPSDSIDYIFTDPPFGSNLMYSELNFINEAWNRVITNNMGEAIINGSQHKDLKDYNKLMEMSFSEYYRVLKPNRWITVVFHNSKSSVWNGIQDSMSKVGFVIAQVSVLDKKQGSFTQATSSGSVKNDLIISAYKPQKSFERSFLEYAGEGLEVDFIRMHLSHLKSEPTVERTEQMLYSKLLAYYVQRNYAVKYDSSTFYKMLRNIFVEEDGFWFTQGQIDSYKEFKQKLKLDGIEEVRSGQMILFIHDEKSAIIWLNTFLTDAKDFKEIHPAYTKVANISGDNVPDIMELLDNNFIFESGKYRRPLSEEEKLSINQKRDRELQREFDVLLLEARGSKKKIKECRKQAVIFGFEQCYKNQKFQDILDIAARLDKNIIENDSEINEFIEVAEIKVEGF